MSLIKRNHNNGGNAYLPSFTNLVEQFFDDDSIRFPLVNRGKLPAINIKDNKDNYEVEVAAPGLNKDDFKIKLENNVLTISADKEENNEEKNDKYSRREFYHSSFVRSFQFSEQEVDADRIEAKYENGLLRINLPKKEEAKKREPKQINIS